MHEHLLDDRVSLALDALQSLAAHTTGASAVAVLPVEHASLADLYPSERALVARAARSRQTEFAAGRNCARRALADLGVASCPVGLGRRGEPIWPPDYVGSITHSAGLAAAVAALRNDRLTSIGIDVELADSLDESLWATVLLASEQAACAQSDSPVRRATMLFSAKEALFKAQFPLTGLELDFLDVELVFADQTTTTATVRIDVVEVASPSRAGARPRLPTVSARTSGDLVIAFATAP
jgi:4'-phosphopantetheinyl transferase EntD